MWAIFLRAFAWLSSGYVLNDIASTTGKIFGVSSSDTKEALPRWVVPSVIVAAIIAFVLWMRKRKS